MKTFGQFVLCLLVVALVAGKPGSVHAAKKDKGKDATARLQKKLSAAELSPETRTKVKEVLAKNAAKLKEAQAKIDAVLTAEQKQARDQAKKDARASGKKGKEARAAVEGAMKLSAEQKSKLSAAEGELKSAQAALTKELRSAMSSEEFAKAGLKTKKKG